MAVLAGRNTPLFGKQGRLTILPETEFKLSIKGKFLLMGKKKKNTLISSELNPNANPVFESPDHSGASYPGGVLARHGDAF